MSSSLKPDFFDGLQPEFVIEVDKETGCYMSTAGTMPEWGWAFLYHDNRHHLYFYADRKWDGPMFDVSVWAFSKMRFGGPTPFIREADLPVIRKNMEKFFRERDFGGSASPRSPDEVFRNLHFDWDPHSRKFVI